MSNRNVKMAPFSAVTCMWIYCVYCVSDIHSTHHCHDTNRSANYRSLNNRNHHSVDNDGLYNCAVVMDLETYTFDHVLNPEPAQPIQAGSPEYRCTVEIHPDCVNTSAVLVIGSASNCTSSVPRGSRGLVSSRFNVGNFDNQTCQNSSCMTFVEVQVEYTNETKQLIIIETSDIDYMDNVFQDFSNLTLRYQTCMNETLTFRIPMSANVPLSVSCSGYDGLPLLPDECLIDASTTTEYDNNVTENTRNSDEIDAIDEDSKSKENEMFLLSSTVIYIIIGSGCFIVLFIAIVGAVVFTRRRTRKKRESKADYEIPNVNVTVVQGTDNRVSHSQTYQEIGDVPGTNNEALQQALDEQEQQEAESSTIDGFGGGYADIGSFKPHAKVASENTAKGNNNESDTVDDVKQPQLSSEELENLYAKPIKDRPTMVESGMYESSGTNPTTRETQSSTLEQPEVPVKTQEGDAPDPGGEYSCIKDAL